MGYLHSSPSVTPNNELSHSGKAYDWQILSLTPFLFPILFHLPPILLLPHFPLPYSPSSSQFSNNLHLIPISPIANIQSFVLGHLHANGERKPDILQLLNGRTHQHALWTPKFLPISQSKLLALGDFPTMFLHCHLEGNFSLHSPEISFFQAVHFTIDDKNIWQMADVAGLNRGLVLFTVVTPGLCILLQADASL